MNATRAFNVMTLTTILLLAGCFGADDSSASADETDDGTITVNAQDLADAMLLASNSPPELSVKKFLMDFEAHDDVGLVASNWEMSGYFFCVDDLESSEGGPVGETLEEQRASLEGDLEEGEYLHLANVIEVGDCLVYFDFLSLDPDGDSMTKGIDTNFDGIIDIPIVPNHGFTVVAIDNSTNKQIWNLMQTECEQIDLAFIAVDEHGASTVEFIHFMGIDSCDEESNFDEVDLMIYNFDADDAAGTMSDGGDDALVEITMMYGNDLNWAMLKVVISVDGGTPMACADAAIGDAFCIWTPFEVSSANAAEWEVGEGITISEGPGDLCDGSMGGCDVQVTITKAGMSGAPDVVLATLNAYAES